MTGLFNLLLENTLSAVLAEIESHKEGQPTSFPIGVLNNVKVELELMIKFKDPKKYIPTYPRFIIDMPHDFELGDKLLEASYLYEKIKK